MQNNILVIARRRGWYRRVKKDFPPIHIKHRAVCLQVSSSRSRTDIFLFQHYLVECLYWLRRHQFHTFLAPHLQQNHKRPTFIILMAAHLFAKTRCWDSRWGEKTREKLDIPKISTSPLPWKDLAFEMLILIVINKYLCFILEIYFFRDYKW